MRLSPGEVDVRYEFEMTGLGMLPSLFCSSEESPMSAHGLDTTTGENVGTLNVGTLERSTISKEIDKAVNPHHSERRLELPQCGSGSLTARAEGNLLKHQAGDLASPFRGAKSAS